jgi:hypothetical protein
LNAHNNTINTTTDNTPSQYNNSNDTWQAAASSSKSTAVEECERVRASEREDDDPLNEEGHGEGGDRCVFQLAIYSVVF